MDIPTPISVALLGGVATLVGYFVSNSLERQKAIRLREMEFRLDRYREFLIALISEHAEHSYETQLQFVNSTNVILIIGGAGLVKAIKDLVHNYNDEKGTEKQWKIVDRILFQMRCDLNAPDSKELEKFEFPIIIPDTRRKTANKNAEH